MGHFADIPSGEVERDPPARLPRHDWLNFPDRSGALTRGMMYGRIHPLAGRHFNIIGSLNLSDDVTVALLRRVEEYLTYPVRDRHNNIIFLDPSFGNLVRLVHPVAEVLVLEFFASLEVDKRSTDFAAVDYVSFRLGGQRRQCSLFEFGRRIGLYTMILTPPPSEPI